MVETPQEANQVLDEKLDEQVVETQPEAATDLGDGLQEKFSKALAQKKHWREKALGYEAKLKELNNLGESDSEVRAAPVRNRVTPDDVDMAYLAARGYSDPEIDSLRVLAKGTGKRLRDAASLPEAKPLIDWQRSKNKTEQATPASSSRVEVQAQSSDPRANFERIVAKHTRKGGNRGNE